MGGGASKKKKKQTPASAPAASQTAKQTKVKQEHEQNMARATSKGLAFSGQIQKGDYHHKYKDVHVELGSGMSGTVVKVINKKTGDEFARKSVDKNRLDEVDLQDFYNELDILNHLDHPNIVQVVDAYECKNVITIIMELCHGGELYDCLISRRSYSEQRARMCMRQMISAVGFCHKMGIAHRDLKLENFMFEGPKKGQGSLKLIDFGLSKKYHGHRIKRMESIVGTSYYMAPEVLLSIDPYGNECDVWSLGVLLFMMIAGYPPFQGGTDFEIMKNVRKGKYHFDPSAWSSYPMVQDIVSSMLTMDPKKRPTCAELIQHPWFKQEKVETKAIQSEVLVSLNKFAKKTKFLRVAAHAAKHILTQSEIRELSDTFKTFDQDGSGHISLEEFVDGMTKHVEKKSDETEEDFKALFKSIDLDNTGLISYSEFLSASLSIKEPTEEHQLVEMFDRLDRDKNGYIDRKEMVVALQDVFHAKELKDMIVHADKHCKDGRMSRDEFLKFIREHEDEVAEIDAKMP